MIFFSIIIPTCNRNKSLVNCLNQLSPGKQKELGVSYEVIVSDDSTNNASKNLIHHYYPWVKWVVGPKQGPAANRNNGASHATGEWLIFTDDDCIPDEKWLSAYYIYTQTNLYKALEGKILPTNQDFKDLWKCPINEHGGNFWSANIGIKNDLFKEIKGFDYHFPYPAYEDTDLFYRVKKHTSVCFVKDALVYHPIVHYTLLDAIYKDIHVFQSRAYLLAKHTKRSWLNIFRTLINEYGIHIKGFIYSFQKKFWKNIFLHGFILVCILPQLFILIPKYQKKIVYDR